MNKIQQFLIHFLGGYTDEDLIYQYKLGVSDILDVIKEKMESLYGFEADAWCSIMYEYIYQLQKIGKFNEQTGTN